MFASEHLGWQPTATLSILKRRAQFIADVRRFFSQRDILEVETPILSQSAPTAPYLDSFSTNFVPIGSQKKQVCYLHTSPEFAMKRLLAAGSGPIYQIARVFRNGELGRNHSPEFTMLEWYRPGLSLHQLMDEVNTLLQRVFNLQAISRLSYQGLFAFFFKLNVFNCSDETIKQCALDRITSLPKDFQTDRDGWLELLMSHVVEPRLAAMNLPVFVYDFPASQAQLAKVKKDESGNKVAERFELYFNGVEIANGYNELLNADELCRRFESDNQQRRHQGRPEMPIDHHLLAAMQHGLPSCSGVALGLDRLMMLIMNKSTINEVLSFGFEKA